MSGRLWGFSTLAVYAYLAFFSWCFYREEAHAAGAFQDFREVSAPKKRASASGGSKVPYRNIRRVEGGYAVEFGFRNFNNDALSIKTKLSDAEVAKSISEFGFKREDFEALDFWYQIAQENAIAAAKKRAAAGAADAQRTMDREIERLAGEYRKRRLKLYQDAGFQYKSQGVVEVNIPQLVEKSWRRVRPIAGAFAQTAEAKGYDADDLVGAATAWVQTSLTYEVPATNEGSRVIAGVLPPLKAVVLGQGDCDTKSALLASVLKNWPNLKLVGLGIPEHYLMAVHRIPRRGDVFIEHQGISYVMIESAGPAWIPPGQVGDQTLAYLQGGNTFRIQPL